MDYEEAIQYETYGGSSNHAGYQTQNNKKNEGNMGSSEYDVTGLFVKPRKKWEDRPFLTAYRVHFVNDKERKSNKKENGRGHFDANAPNKLDYAVAAWSDRY
jgi:hypothetical protein